MNEQNLLVFTDLKHVLFSFKTNQNMSPLDCIKTFFMFSLIHIIWNLKPLFYNSINVNSNIIDTCLSPISWAGVFWVLTK